MNVTVKAVGLDRHAKAVQSTTYRLLPRRLDSVSGRAPAPRLCLHGEVAGNRILMVAYVSSRHELFILSPVC